MRRALPALHRRSARLSTAGWDHEVDVLDDASVLRFPNEPSYADVLRTEVQVLAEQKARGSGRVRLRARIAETSGAPP